MIIAYTKIGLIIGKKTKNRRRIEVNQTMFKKGQAAMEFLMTYGWAILVVLAAIGALAYFGVLSPDNLLPERTSFQAPIPHVDNAYIQTSGLIEIPFSNNVGFPVELHIANAAVSDLEVGGADATCTGVGAVIDDVAADKNVTNNNNFRFAWNCTGVTFTKNARVKGTLTFEYKNQNTQQVRLHTGTINGKVA